MYVFIVEFVFGLLRICRRVLCILKARPGTALQISRGYERAVWHLFMLRAFPYTNKH